MRQAAERSVELNPHCQMGWGQLVFVNAYGRDLAALRAAAERTFSLNPLNTATIAIAATMLANAGDWERGMEVVRKAMAPNPNHAGWYHHVFFADHYRRAEYEEALAILKRVNMPGWPRAALGAAATAGQLGRIAEACSALENLAKIDPGLLDPAAARHMWAIWHWDEELVDRFVEGFLKAKALESADGEMKTKPASGSGSRASSTVLGNAMAIAVRPFTTHNDDADSKSLAGGLSDDIPAGLSRFAYLSVAGAAESARFLIEGSVRQAAATIRVSARLVDAETGAHMWAETYTRDTHAADLFALQDDITNRIVATVADANGVLVRAMGSPLRERPCEELAIGELILRYQVFTQQFQRDEYVRLRGALENALQREPAHAEAWSCLAMLYHNEYVNVPTREPQRDGLLLGREQYRDEDAGAPAREAGPLDRMRAAAQRAIDLDPVCQRGWFALAFWCFHTRDLPGLRAAAERTVALNPLSTSTLAGIARMRAFAGDWDEGVANARQAMDLNPHHPGWYRLPSFYNCYRQSAYEEALQIAKRINAPGAPLTAAFLAATLGKLGRRAEAQTALEALGKLDPALLQPERLRAAFAIPLWDERLIDDLMDGFLKAKVLVETESAKPLSGQLASIAVLPFTDMSEAKDQEWFCDGIAEEILNALTHLKGVNVAARTSAFSFRGKSDDLRSIGEKLHVTTVLEGSVRRSGDRLRITVQLNEVANGYRLWSERYDRELKDIFDVQDEIAKAVAERLKVTLAGGTEARLVHKATENVEAYQLYLKGRALLYQRGGGIPLAMEQFKKAVEFDPSYAAAWAGIADGYTVLSYFGLVPGRETKPKALAAARRSVELDPNSAEGHTALAAAALVYQRDRRTAEREFVRALELNPSYIQGRCWYAILYLQLTCGRLEEGVAEGRRALASDPLSAYARGILAHCLARAGQSDEAIEQARAAVQADPASFLTRSVVGLALLSASRFDDAAAAFREAMEISGRQTQAVGFLATALARGGRQSEARALYNELVDRSRLEYIPFFWLALTAAAAGENDQALDLAERSWQEREPVLLLYASHAEESRWFQQQPRFQAILRKMDAL